MIPNNKTTLIINRFVVSKSGRAVYDQKFHKGINIIRGDNSVGKSTVMDLMYFALGGDLREERWNSEAASCDGVYVEIEINNSPLTLHRVIDPSNRPPMSILAGTYESAFLPNAAWSIYGVARNQNKYSFSQQLFELMGWPHHQTDDNSNLTMHQVLRLIYVDQDTPVNKILKYEPSMDKPSMRQAIGEFLLGIDDLETYSLRQRISKAENEFSKIQGQLEAIYRIIPPTEGILRDEHLNNEIQAINSNLMSLIKNRESLLLDPDESLTPDAKLEAEKLGSEIKIASDTVSSLLSRKAEITNEIVESELFLSSLDFRIKSLQESKTAFDFFGEVKFKFCPSCLSQLDNQNSNSCNLCKNPVDSEIRTNAYLSALNELNFQKKESTKVLSELSTRLTEISETISIETASLNSLKSKSRTTLIVNSSRILKLNEISSEIGSLEQKLKELERKAELIAGIEQLIKKKDELNKDLETYRDALKQNKAANERRRDSIESELSERTVNLITQDKGFEEAFKNPQTFEYDFSKDIMLVDGRSKFSASSETILKNSFHFAIFLLSLFDEFARYPRLLLLDNIEDKGMRPERSQNFQNLVVMALDGIEVEHQVIMTTSMIAENLEGSKYCVGPYYKKGMHTLIFSSPEKAS